MSSDLTRAAAHGAAWTGISQILGQGVRLVSMIILVRLLLPEDFGIAAMAAIVTVLLVRVVDMGFGEAIIQRKELTASHLSTAFWTMLGLGIILCLSTVAISPLFANFFRNELVRPILAVSSILFIIYSLGSVPAAVLRKRLSFFRTSVSDVAEAVIYLMTAVPAAFAGFGVWSLVIGNLAGAAALTIFRWVLCGWHPSFTFSLNSLKDLWWFGANVTGTRIIDALGWRTLDYLILGRFLTATVLGFYSIALRVPAMVADGMWFIVNRVALPVFSQVQDEEDRMRRGLLKGIAYSSIVMLPLFAGLALTAPELVKVVFGYKWIPSIILLQILCIGIGAGILVMGVPSVFLAKGRPDINLKLRIVQVVLLIPSLLIGVRFGAIGIATAVSAVSVMYCLLRIIFVNRLLGMRMGDYLASLRPAALGSLVMSLALLAFRHVVTELLILPDIAMLISSVVLGAVIYFVILKAIRTQALNELIELVLGMVRLNTGLATVKTRFLRRTNTYDN